MPSTPSAYPQVLSRRFAYSNSTFPQLTSIFGVGSIPGSSTEKQAGQSNTALASSFFHQHLSTHPGETTAGVMTAHPAGQQTEASSTSTYRAPGVVAKATTLLAGQRK